MIAPKRLALAALGVLISTTAAFAQIGGAPPRPGDAVFRGAAARAHSPRAGRRQAGAHPP